MKDPLVALAIPAALVLWWRICPWGIPQLCLNYLGRKLDGLRTRRRI